MELDHTRRVRRDGCMNGGRRLGSCVAGRSTSASTLMLDLRQHRHHHRGQRRPSSFLDSHIGYGSPHKQDIAAAHGEALAQEELPPVEASYGWPENAEVPRPRRRRERFEAGIGERGAKAPPSADMFDTCNGLSIPIASEIDQMQRRELPARWDRNLPVCRPPEGVAGRDASGRGAEGYRAEYILVSRRLADLRAVEQDTLRSMSPEIPGRRPGRKEPAFRHPRARDGGDRGGPALSSSGFRRNLLRLSRLRSACHPAGSSRAAALDLSSRTTPWAMARIALPTSRWSSCCRCGYPELRDAEAGRRQRGSRGLPYVCSCVTSPSTGVVAPIPPTLIRSKCASATGSRSRCRCSGRCPAGAGADPVRFGELRVLSSSRPTDS